MQGLYPGRSWQGSGHTTVTPKEAEALGCAYFNNGWGGPSVLRICYIHNPQLWPSSRIHNEDGITCPGCIEMLARRTERAIDTCRHYGLPRPREDCDICMGRGVWSGLT